MAAWAGFSEDELRKVKNLPTNDNVKRKECSFESKDHQGSKGKSRPAPRATTNNTRVGAKPAQQTMSPVEKSHSEHKGGSNDSVVAGERVVVKTEPMTPDMVVVKQEIEVVDKIQDLDDTEALSRDLMHMEKFREQQKQIEEANKQKKALLSKTLTERKKAAAKEAYKLEHIQKELSKLDTLLTADVNVIRGKIEDASREFMDAQRRFERAESEYVAAKMALHDKQELKEQLTEHLYTIIHQNEVRKAKKLADLMKKLEMEIAGMDDDLSLPELPPLTSFQPTSMHLSPTGVRQLVSQGSHEGQVSNLQEEGKTTSSDNSEGLRNSVNVSQGGENTPGSSCVKDDTKLGKETAESDSGTTVSPDSSNSAVNSHKIENPVEIEAKISSTVENDNNHTNNDSAVDLSIVKTEMIDKEEDESKGSKALATSKWDFDGSVT